MHAPTRAFLALTALMVFSAPAAQASEAAQFMGKTLYNMVGGMLVDGATNGGDMAITPTGPAIPSHQYSAADALSNESYSPADGVTCYPKQGLCFKSSGKLDSTWTNRIYNN